MSIYKVFLLQLTLLPLLIRHTKLNKSLKITIIAVCKIQCLKDFFFNSELIYFFKLHLFFYICAI